MTGGDKRVALVTGASRGIGAAIARMLAEQQMTVVGTATREAGAAAITEALSGLGGTGKVHYVMSFDDWAEMAAFGDKVAASEEFRFLQAAAAGAATPIGSIQGEPLYYTGQ